MVLWLWLTIVSGALLGLYDIAKKKALESSPLFCVLALYSLFNLLFVGYEFPGAIHIDGLSLGIIFIKSLVIFVSWILGFVAIKGLPISIITPFGTLSPLFTVIMGVTVLGERLGWVQVAGLGLIFASYYFIGKIGTIEITGLFKNRNLYFMAAAMFLSACSALIDKVVLKRVTTGQMQFWFSLFVAGLYLAALAAMRWKDPEKALIKFNWYIPLMSLLLVVSDRIYFTAVKIPDSAISIIMPLRKISIIVSAIIGGILFKEKNLRAKFACICILLVGIAVEFAGK